MKRKVKLVLGAVLVVVCAVAGIAYAMAPVAVETEIVRARTAAVTFTEQGSYDYAERRHIYPLVAGEVAEVRVKVGDRVAEGDVLAVVSASDYEYQIAQLESAIAGYNGQIANLALSESKERDNLGAALDSLRGQLTSLEAEMEKNRESDDSLENQIAIQETIIFHNRNAVASARNDLNDARDYSDEDAITAARAAHNAAQNTLAQSELMLEQLKSGNVPEDVYEGQMQSLEAQIASTETQMGKSYSGGMRQYYTAQIAAAQASIEQMREKAGKAEIIAPIAGVVSELPVKDQNLTTQQAPVAVIGAGGRVEVYVPIREIDGVAVGDKVELTVDKRLGRESIPGVVTEIEGEAVVRLSALGVEERKVRVLIRPEESGLVIGYDMDVRFTVYTRENALVVPKTAVFDTPDGDFVWVLAGGLLERRGVVKGVETRDGFIVDEGVADGDVVVADADNQALAAGKKAVAE